jgi:citrate synthase
MLLNTTGKLPEKKLADWLEAAFICISWPDSRIWCNQIGALGGAARTTAVSAVCAGIIASDSRMYGVGPLGIVASFIKDLKEKTEHGWPIEKFYGTVCKKENRLFAPGYARPLARGDERIASMERVTKSLGYNHGPHMRSAFALNEFLYKHHQESINIGGYIVAFLCDQGFSPKEILRINSIIVNGGIHACYAESADDLPNGYLPLNCDDILYTGKPERAIKK